MDLTTIPGLAAAIHAAAPRADVDTWVAALTGVMLAAEITSNLRVAAFLGQCTVESGGFERLAENTCYTTGARLVAVFPREFPDLAATEGYVGNAERIASRCYAGRLGNGDEASGDGWTFRGSGLLQVTGRATVSTFAETVSKSPEDAANWLRTPEGAAAGACWFWTVNNLNRFADGWQLSAITRAVNGPAMLGSAQRNAASNAARKAMSA